MAREIRSFQAVIPAGTAQTSPIRISVAMPVRKVDTLEIVVPPGPSGMMGFAITMGGVNIIPVQPGTYMVTDDERIVWDLTNLPTSGAWQVSGYNTGNFDHTVYLRWLVDIVDAPSSQSPLMGVDLSVLSST